jgi:NADPH:quinone reductase-like Zn-dependent oxidoreductase
VFETVGGATWSHSLKSLKPGGRVVVSGATSGDADAAELQRVFFLQLSVVGSTMGTRDELADLLAFLDREDMRPRIGQELALDSAAEGVEAMIEGRTSGKIVFTL